MNRSPASTIAALALLMLLVPPAALAEEVLAPGVTFQIYNLPGPRVAYVVRAERDRTDYQLIVGWPQGVRNFTARAQTSAIAAHYHNPPQVDVVAAVNASFYGTIPEVRGATASDGELLEQASGNYDTAVVLTDRTPVVLKDIPHAAGTVRMPDGTTLPVAGYNRALSPPQTMAYTRNWGRVTMSSPPIDLAAIVLRDVSYPLRPGKEIVGRVTARLLGPGAVPVDVPPDGLVLLGTGPFRTAAAEVSNGQRLAVRFNATQPDWSHVHFAITGVGWLVHNSAPHTSNWSQYGFSTERHPRTVLAWNDTHWFFFAVDGRSPASIGMTFAEMAAFLTQELGATEAINLDGGGSTTIVTHGTVRNVPSDGTERAVANAVLLVRRDRRTPLPFADTFPPTGRGLGWDDGRSFQDVAPLAPAAPQGDGIVLCVRSPDAAPEFVRRGDWGDTNYSVQADVFCEHRPDLAPGFERGGIFARDAGLGTFDARTGARGRAYVLSYDAHDGRIRAGRLDDGVLTDFLDDDPLLIPETGWRRLRIDCWGGLIRYWIDGAVVAEVEDDAHGRGLFGAGHQVFGIDPAAALGARIDNFQVTRAHGDYDGSDRTDAGDLPSLLFCLRGPAQHFPLGQYCRSGDFDGDGAVDVGDVAWFQRLYEGAATE